MNVIEVDNWCHIDRDLYALAYERWGGSFITHPGVIDRVREVSGQKVELFGAFHKGHLVGVAPICKDWLLGPKIATSDRIDTGQCEIILPLDPCFRFKLPWRYVALSGQHTDQVIGAHPMELTVALMRPLIGQTSLSARKRSNLRRQQRRVIEAGGRLIPMRELSPSIIAQIYGDFHRQRWGREARGINDLADLLEAGLQNFLFGYYMVIREEIKAVQLHYLVVSNRCVYVEGVQHGHDEESRQLGLGNVVTWASYLAAVDVAAKLRKTLRYSLGFMERGYKESWCVPSLLLTSESHSDTSC